MLTMLTKEKFLDIDFIEEYFKEYFTDKIINIIA